MFIVLACGCVGSQQSRKGLVGGVRDAERAENPKRFFEIEDECGRKLTKLTKTSSRGTAFSDKTRFYGE
jgi:hypothetical protein